MPQASSGLSPSDAKAATASQSASLSASCLKATMVWHSPRITTIYAYNRQGLLSDTSRAPRAHAIRSNHSLARSGSATNLDWKGLLESTMVLPPFLTELEGSILSITIDMLKRTAQQTTSRFCETTPSTAVWRERQCIVKSHYILRSPYVRYNRSFSFLNLLSGSYTSGT